MKEKFYAFISGAFFIGAVYGLTIASAHVCIPCIVFSLMSLVLATD